MEIKVFSGAICFLVLLGLLFLTAPCLAAAPEPAGLPGVSAAMLRADFWIERTPSPQQVILTPSQIVEFNQAILAALPQTMVDFDRFPEMVDRSTLQRWLAADRLPRDAERYSRGELLTGAFYDRLAQNLNLRGLRETNPVRWGFTVRRTDLRTFPTSTASSEDDESDDFDLFQETAVNIAEPLAILHRSGDGVWLYVQIYNYRGWLRAADVALSPSRQAWNEKRRSGKFLVITGAKVVPREAVMGKPVPDWRAGMGSRLPLLGMEQGGYAVEIPLRNSDGNVYWHKAWIHGKADVSTGFLPYTRANILRQAFKMLGEDYGWGGLGEGRDCSSFIMDIYNVFGIWSPRNADQQERVPGRRSAWRELRMRPLARLC
jgi:hypothetical protein